MLTIKLDDVDKLHNISTELGIITYLQALLQYDNYGNVICEEDLEFAKKSCELYLWQRQFETVIRLRKLLTSAF